MVCIAAFIILCLVGVFVAFISIFRRDIGRKYWAVFKKAWGCVWKKVRLQKCETNFKDDVKNSLLSKVVLKHPTWVKPLGTAIEVSAVLIVLITIWSLIESVKALLAIWVFGTCNVSQPASCALGAEVCGIDAEEPKNVIEWTGRWFTEWGEIFVAIPDRLQKWQAEDYLVEPYTFVESYQDNHPLALDILDPGCSACLQSYRNQKSSGFFEKYNTVVMIYPIQLPNGEYKFANSGLVARYLHAADLLDTEYSSQILDRIMTGSDDKGVIYQSIINNSTSDEVEKLLQAWLKEFGASSKEIQKIKEASTSAEVDHIMAQIKTVVEDQLKVKGIPTLIYDEKKHTGAYKDA